MRVSARTATKATCATKKLPRKRAVGRVERGVRVKDVRMVLLGGEGPAWRRRKGSSMEDSVWGKLAGSW